MVSEVKGVDWTVQGAGEDPIVEGRLVWSGSGKGMGPRAYLLMLRLFFLLPNRPWMKIIGGAFRDVVVVEGGGSWRSYASLMPLGNSVEEKARMLVCRMRG